MFSNMNISSLRFSSKVLFHNYKVNYLVNSQEIFKLKVCEVNNFNCETSSDQVLQSFQVPTSYSSFETEIHIQAIKLLKIHHHQH